MGRDRTYWVYILANKLGGTLYIGVTSNLVKEFMNTAQKSSTALRRSTVFIGSYILSSTPKLNSPFEERKD
jgi:GIY-YIG catalytic domain